ncbi:VCBS domain-containing protein [Xanthobacter sp. KR7-65]|uniref:VCBS domain-containing protein n=1 Tax=Xanthobacter sp. KR7-65 TaxID=3156612 RepID=UPI0032B4397E
MAARKSTPTFGAFDRNKTLAENTVNAGPVVLDSNVTLKNPDGTGFEGGALSVKLASAGPDDRLSIAEVGGITVETDAGSGTTSVFYNGVRIGTETEFGQNGSALTVSFDQPVSDDAATALARAIAYSSAGNAPSKAAHALTFTATDAEHTSTSATMQLKVKAGNDAPVVSGLGPVSSHPPTSAADGVIIDGDAHVANPDGTGFKGGKLAVHLDSATATDELYLANGPFSITGTKLYLDGRPVGTVSANGVSGHDLAFTFKGNVAISDAQMSALMEQVAYRSTAPGAPTTPDGVTFTVTDAEKSAVSTHVALAFENQAPTLLSGSPASGIALISVGAAGEHGSGSSFDPAISGDGTAVAFASYAANLAPGVNAGQKQVFIKDLSSGAVVLVSANASGIASNANTPQITATVDVSFSPDGRKVAFVSTASNLVPGDTNATDDVFVKDLDTGAITRISTDSSGAEINAWSGRPVFSPDGTKVAFESGARDLAGDTNGSGLYVKDLVTGATTQVSINEPGAFTPTNGYNPAFSQDGTKIAFVAFGNEFGPNVVGGSMCVFIKDLTTGDVTFVSAASAHEVRPIFSPDGTKIAFMSNESSVVPGGEMWGTHLYVKDLQTGEITCVSSPGGVLPNDGVVSDTFSFSADGTKIVFASSESTLPGNAGGVVNIIVADLQTGELTPITSYANDASSSPVFTPDGAHVIFTSKATNLVANDTNNASDIFIAPVPTSSVTNATLTEDPAHKTLNAAGTYYFADADASDTHTVSVAAPADALGTLTAKIVSDINGTGGVVWSYVVDEAKVEPLAAGETKVESFVLTLDDHHGGTVAQNVTVTLTGAGDGDDSPAIATLAFASAETTQARVGTPDLWASVAASLSGVDEGLSGLFDVLEKRFAALAAAHQNGSAGAFDGPAWHTGDVADPGQIAAQLRTELVDLLDTLGNHVSDQGTSTTATAHHILEGGAESVAAHLWDALHGNSDGGHSLI